MVERLLFAIGRTLAYELIGNGAIPSLRIGRTFRVQVSALETWIDEQASGGPDGRGSPGASPTGRARAIPAQRRPVVRLDRRFHDLRHQAASTLLMLNGGNIVEVQPILATHGIGWPWAHGPLTTEALHRLIGLVEDRRRRLGVG